MDTRRKAVTYQIDVQILKRLEELKWELRTPKQRLVDQALSEFIARRKPG